jgi:hypothetical protein
MRNTSRVRTLGDCKNGDGDGDVQVQDVLGGFLLLLTFIISYSWSCAPLFLPLCFVVSSESFLLGLIFFALFEILSCYCSGGV